MDHPRAQPKHGVVIADRSAAMRAAISRMLAAAPDMEAVGEAEDRAELLRAVRELRPAALILDPGVLGPGGLRSLPLLRGECDGTRIVVADFPEGPAFEQSVLRLGADAFVAKDGAPDAWLDSIRAAVGSGRDGEEPAGERGRSGDPTPNRGQRADGA